METKIGTSFQLRSSFSGGRTMLNRSRTYDTSAETQNANADTFAMSSSEPAYSSLSQETRDKLKELTKKIKEINFADVKWYKLESDTPEGRTKLNFEYLSDIQKEMNDSISKRLEKAGVPSNVTFEFNYNINTQKSEITQISDDEYRKNIETVLNNTYGFGMIFTAFASRVMNGYVSSAYYPAIAKNLESCYEQDIADLYIDENGNIGGANENLQKAIRASKRGEEFYPIPDYHFPAKNVEGIIKRLISDENIIPNVSHMGYDGESIYTNDGEFKFGKDFDPNLFGDEKYVMRGSVSLLINNGYDRWLENEEKFY